MSKVRELSERLKELRDEIDNGTILKYFVPEDKLADAKCRYQSILTQITETSEQLDALIAAEKSKFRQAAQAEFLDKLSNKQPIDPISDGDFIAKPRYTRSVPHPLDDIMDIFNRNNVAPPNIKHDLDLKSMNASQKKLYKSLEVITGVTVVVSSAGEDQNSDE
jgi:hypothetical protein